MEKEPQIWSSAAEASYSHAAAAAVFVIMNQLHSNLQEISQSGTVAEPIIFCQSSSGASNKRILI